ncbi:hypothetical protein [Prosthecobacter sp.]|uniref:hypothetical protein n=1 Tax=Prosthecobacter sp. TaxID=1965333 RepID=UPI002486FCFC|nr:hypothetical protein [Prosthecobacter sp.]MDI1310627.1 hypothetical protein [Prosthecobacter sp.]
MNAQWLSEKGVDQNCLKQMRADALAEAKDAAAYAMTSGLPEPAAIMNDIYWAVDCATSSTPCDHDHFTTPSTSSS